MAELVEITLHMLPADLGECPLVARARPGSERFDPAHMGHDVDILTDRVGDRFPAAVKVPVGRGPVRHNDVLGMDDAVGEAPDVHHALARNHLGGKVPSRLVPCYNDHILVFRGAAHSLPIALVPTSTHLPTPPTHSASRSVR